MKIAVKILKVLVLVMTAIWGIIFGIFAPISIMNNELVSDPIVSVWLINSIVCYVVGTILLMLNLHKIAAGFHTVGMVVTIIIYAVFEQLFAASTTGSPVALYMPVIFISILTIIIAFLTNFKNFEKKLEEKDRKQYEPAPSILGGTTEVKPTERKRKEK